MKILKAIGSAGLLLLSCSTLNVYAAQIPIAVNQLCYTHGGRAYHAPLIKKTLFITINKIGNTNSFFVNTDKNGNFYLSDKNTPGLITSYLSDENHSIIPGCFNESQPVRAGDILLKGIDCPASNCEVFPSN